MKFTSGETETPVDYNFVTDRLLFSTFGGTSYTPGKPETFEIWFSNGYTLQIVAQTGQEVRVNLLPPAKKK